MAKRKKPSTSRSIDLTTQPVGLAEFAAKALAAAELIGIRNKPFKNFPLDHAERLSAAELLSLAGPIKKKLAKQTASFTIAETVSVVMAIADAIREGERLQRFKLLLVAKKLIDCLESNVVSTGIAKTKRPKGADTVFQFKITLLGIKPPIWRRIQVRDCTLDKLHEHIQTSMGWTNSHLHQFKIKGECYGDPELLDDGFGGSECVDSTKMMLGAILPKTGKRFACRYEYDFGDSWEHEILFEGVVPADPKAKYPLCLEGARACPPEDVGGALGYGDLLEAINNKAHEEHESTMEWIGGWFDPEEFDAETATKSMRKGLPEEQG